jgi:hypothetical protein
MRSPLTRTTSKMALLPLESSISTHTVLMEKRFFEERRGRLAMTSDIRAQIESVNAQIRNAFKCGDATALANFYTSGA